MCVLLHLLICAALRVHINVVEALYKIYYYQSSEGPLILEFVFTKEDALLFLEEILYITINNIGGQRES